MHKVRVAVLRGGPSSEYEVSLKTGGTVLKHLSPDAYHVDDILIARDGTWHKNGLPITPHDVLSHVDVVWNALHGHFGEDGKIQHLLELHRVPFTGSGSFASAVGMNKALSKEKFKKEGIKTPYHELITEIPRENLGELFRKFSPPIVIKPVSGGSSQGVKFVKTPTEFLDAVTQALEAGDTVMMEEYIPGVEATVGVIDEFRDHELYALPAIEIRPETAGKIFFDEEAKYGGKIEHIIPGTFTPEVKAELENLARRVHQALGLRHYSRTDFIVSPRRGIFVLEVNTLPGLTEESLLTKALHAVGAPLSHFLDHVLQMALRRK